MVFGGTQSQPDRTVLYSLQENKREAENVLWMAGFLVDNVSGKGLVEEEEGVRMGGRRDCYSNQWIILVLSMDSTTCILLCMT